MYVHSERGWRGRLLTFVVVALVGVAANAQPAEQINGPGQKFVDDYVKAWNAGNAEAMGRMWAPDGELIDAQGKVVDRKALLATRLAKPQGERPSLSITLDKVRLLNPDVALVDGESKMAAPDGSASQQTRFSGVLVKQDGAWRLRLIRQLSTRQTRQNPPEEPLQDLGWLVGEWEGMGNGMRVHASASWDLGNRFVVTRFEYEPENGDAYSAEVRAGWDPELQTIKSWYFDSRGVISSTIWQKSGEHFLGAISGARTNGESFTGTMAVTQIDKDSYLRTMSNMKMGDRSVPDQELRMFRVAAPPAE